MDIQEAVKVLIQAGAVFSFPPEMLGGRSLTVEQAAERLGFSRTWVVAHLTEFPGVWRAPGGGRNGGELRIPVRDVMAFEVRRRVFSK
jgi:hypothetical protein